MSSDSSIPKSQFVNGLRSPNFAILDRSSDWELNPSRRAVEHGKLVKRQKSTASGSNALGTSPIPPSFRINSDGTIMREDASNDSAPASTPFPEKLTSSSSYTPISHSEHNVGCSCFNSFGFRFRGLFAQQESSPTPNMLLLRHQFSSHQLPTFPT